MDYLKYIISKNSLIILRYFDSNFVIYTYTGAYPENFYGGGVFQALFNVS